MLNSFVQKEFDMEICINGNFDTVFDLSYTLVDLQAVVSGFLYVSSVEQHPYIIDYVDDESFMVAENNHEKIADEVIYNISNKFPQINKDIQDELRKEIDDSLLYVLDNKKKLRKTREGYISTTPRNFAQRYKNALKLKGFKSGSLILQVTSSIISGMLLEFIKRLILKETKNNEAMSINIINNIINIDKKNNIITVNNNSLDKHIIINDKISNKYISINSKEYIDDIISKVSIESNNYEENVSRFLRVLSDEGIIEKGVIYNEKGIKTMAKDIKRLTGRFIDMYV